MNAFITLVSKRTFNGIIAFYNEIIVRLLKKSIYPRNVKQKTASKELARNDENSLTSAIKF